MVGNGDVRNQQKAVAGLQPVSLPMNLIGTLSANNAVKDVVINDSLSGIVPLNRFVVSVV